MRMKFIICRFFSISIVFIINKALMYFVMRSFFLIFLFLFRFKANNYDIKKARVFNCINAKIDDCIRGVNI